MSDAQTWDWPEELVKVLEDMYKIVIPNPSPGPITIRDLDKAND
jgi:hypothetical protein